MGTCGSATNFSNVVRVKSGRRRRSPSVGTSDSPRVWTESPLKLAASFLVLCLVLGYLRFSILAGIRRDEKITARFSWPRSVVGKSNSGSIDRTCHRISASIGMGHEAFNEISISLGTQDNDSLEIEVRVAMHGDQPGDRIVCINPAAIGLWVGNKPCAPTRQISFRDDVRKRSHSKPSETHKESRTMASKRLWTPTHVQIVRHPISQMPLLHHASRGQLQNGACVASYRRH